MLRYITSIPAFWRVFIIKGCRILSKVFLCFYWHDHMIFTLKLVNVVYYRLVDLKNFLYLLDKSYLTIVIFFFFLLHREACGILLMYYWIWFVSILLRIFALCSSLIFSLVQFSCSVMSDSLQPHESQHARPPCPSPTPGVYSNSCPLS